MAAGYFRHRQASPGGSGGFSGRGGALGFGGLIRDGFIRSLLRTLHELRTLSAGRCLVAVALTILNYRVMTAYDARAVRYLGRRIRYGRTALASFSSFTFSNSAGLSVLGSGAVRYRLYSLWGLSVVKIAQVIIFASFTAWLGILTLAGVSLLVEPLPILSLPWVPFRFKG